MILYHLRVKSLEGKGIYDIADLFNVSHASVDRAVRWPKDKEVVALSGGRVKSMMLQFKKHKLWDKMLPFLTNPIKWIIYTDSLSDEVFCTSGVNTSSEYSMLNKERNNTHAIVEEEVRRLRIRTDKKYGETRIKVWRYNPCLFSRNGIVNKLSLFLVMKSMDDERIQIELETMIDNMIW